MSIRFWAVGAVLVLAACEPIPVGGAGQTTRGEAIVGEAIVDPLGNENRLIIRSPRGWVCDSTFPSNHGRNSGSANRTVPLTCNNGARGNAIMSIGNFGNRLTVAFSLSNGESGNLVIEP
jgi:hypothetical protein